MKSHSVAFAVIIIIIIIIIIQRLQFAILCVAHLTIISESI